MGVSQFLLNFYLPLHSASRPSLPPSPHNGTIWATQLRRHYTSTTTPETSAMTNSPRLQGKPSSDTQLSAKEFFESFLHSRQYTGDLISKASDMLWGHLTLEEDERKLRQVKDKLQKFRMDQIEGDNEQIGLLKLIDSRSWILGDSDAPRNVISTLQEIVLVGEDRRRKSMLEYEALKRELYLVTIAVGTACTTYCFFVLPSEATLSYFVGSIVSLLYLHSLYNHADKVSSNNVAEIFLKRKTKKIGFRSQDFQDFFERITQGLILSLSSPRLVFPGVLFTLWCVTKHTVLGFTIPYHLQLAPMFLGFFAYKAAVIIQAYRDNKDLCMSFTENEHLV